MYVFTFIKLYFIFMRFIFVSEFIFILFLLINIKINIKKNINFQIICAQMKLTETKPNINTKFNSFIFLFNIFWLL